MKQKRIFLVMAAVFATAILLGLGTFFRHGYDTTLMLADLAGLEAPLPDDRPPFERRELRYTTGGEQPRTDRSAVVRWAGAGAPVGSGAGGWLVTAAETSGASVRPKQTFRKWVGPGSLFLVTFLGVGAVLWGYFNPPDIRVVQFDAGPVSQWKSQRIVGFPDQQIYVVALDDGRLRALDTRIDASDCVAQWRPDDVRGVAKNPAGLPGVFEDACSGGVWSMIGDAISGSEVPLRTPLVDARPDTRPTSRGRN